MITRKEIEAQYEVVDGFIYTVGKFEGEPVYTPYFYEMKLDGRGEYQDNGDGCQSYHLPIDDAAREEFPELKDCKDVWIEEFNDTIAVFVDCGCPNHGKTDKIYEDDDLGDIPPGTDSRP